MKTLEIWLFIMLGLAGCRNDQDNTKRDLENINGVTENRLCRCSPSAWRNLIVVYNNNDTIYYNPVNLPEEFKDNNYNIVFSADLLNDSSIVYTNLANDAVVEAFKARNIWLSGIRMHSNLNLNEETELVNNKLYNSYENNLSFKIDSVLEDSRCPSGVMCIWEGNAKVRFDFSLNNKLTQFSLNTANSFRRDTTITGYKIQLIRVNPYPVYPGLIKQSDYTTLIKITK